MHIKAVRTIRTRAAVCDTSLGYNRIDNPAEWIEVCIALTRAEAALLPPANRGDAVLKAVLDQRLCADRYRYVSDARTPEVMLSYKVLGRTPFGTTNGDKLAKIVFNGLQCVLGELRHAAA